MITAKDSEFHPSDPKEWRWTETTPLIFSVPEAGILGNLYVAARPNLGVALSAVAVAQGFCRQAYEMDFSDSQVHLPCPDDFLGYTLENGLSVELVKPPKEYRFRYEYKGDPSACAFDLKFRSIHEPFDCLDPAQNPMMEKPGGHSYDSRLGDQWGNKSADEKYPNGHYEMIGHVTGELLLRGKTYKVDCYDCMDHSWSRRTEVSKRSVCFLTAAFGEDYGIHLAVPMDVGRDETTYDGFRFGFVVEDGQTYGVVDAKVDGATTDMLPMSAHVTCTDTRGKTHEFYGAAVGGHPWYNFNPSHVCFQSLMRWQQGNRIGYSEMGNIFGLEFLAERKSRHGRER
ncbi:MAG: hypothetical protein AB7O39_00370 [Flavobacteriaceae bacterium]